MALFTGKTPPYFKNQMSYAIEQQQQQHQHVEFTFAEPSVTYACPCSDTDAPLTALLFCPDCCTPRCARCIAHETACYFCPLCLFEVPSSSVKNERNRCARNCFECPVCRSSLAVMADSASSVPRHYLQCGFCRWDSRENNIVFDRATGLGGALLKREEQSTYAREFLALKADLEQKVAASARAPTSMSRIHSPHLALLSPSFSSLHRHLGSGGAGAGVGGGTGRGSGYGGGPLGMGGVGASASHSAALAKLTGGRLGGGANTSGGNTGGDYRPLVPFDATRDHERVARMRDLHYVEEIPALDQRMNQPLCDVLDPLLPLRTHLRAKLAKRCRGCDKQLIKPEPKAQSTRFKVKHVALAHLPAITLAHPMPLLVQNVPATLLLRFTNPRDEDLQVSLSALDSVWTSVHLVCPVFSVPSVDEAAAYGGTSGFGGDEDMFGLEPGMAPHGVVAVRGNSVVVEAQVIPRGGLGSTVEFQLIVSFDVVLPPGVAGNSGEATPTSSPMLLRRLSRAAPRPATRRMDLSVTVVAGSVSSVTAFPDMM
ncbi:dynactin p62 family-domain-containing protein [Blastocladiella britannica]|nr:dynactin p62 family-domain-containing protein [Blastocladiella britannica]